MASGAEFSDRSDWLLFFIALPTQIGLIDVRSHNEPGIFQAVDLVEKAVQSWTDHFEGYRLKGVTGLARPPATDANSIKSLRAGGVTGFLEIAGNVYMPPGLGVTTAATSTRVSLERNKVKQLARAAGDFFAFHGELVRSSLDKGKPHPTLNLRVSDRGRLVAYCETEKRTEGFPPNGRSTARTELEERLLPQWAADRLVTHLAATGSPAVKSTHSMGALTEKRRQYPLSVWWLHTPKATLDRRRNNGPLRVDFSRQPLHFQPPTKDNA